MHQTPKPKNKGCKRAYINNNYVSPNVANMKLRMQYQDDEQNESETENDSHKSNSKRKQKRVLAGEEPCMKKTNAYEGFENSAFENCTTNRESISSFGNYVQGAFMNDKENVSEFKRPQLVVKVQKPQNTKRKSQNENIQILPVRDEEQTFLSEQTVDTPLNASDSNMMSFQYHLNAQEKENSSAILKQDKKSLQLLKLQK